MESYWLLLLFDALSGLEDALVDKQNKLALSLFEMIPFLSLTFLTCVLLQPMKCDLPNVGYIILQQHSNPYHKKLAQHLYEDIHNQSLKINSNLLAIAHEDILDVQGFWTVHPLFQKISEHEDLEWILFLEDHTQLDVGALHHVLNSYDPSKDIFAGYVLKDSSPTIIHHFASSEALSYPHFSAGFFISLTLVKKLTQRCGDCIFSIDPKYELAKFIWDTAGVKLISEPRLCLQRNEGGCATWVKESFPHCGPPVLLNRINVAVKTCKKFHEERLPIVKTTWAPHVQNLLMFSDSNDSSIPTIGLDIENVASGHCEKTLSIMKYYIDNGMALDWLIIVDDDTLLNFGRLRKLLSCYDPSQKITLGERYGYSVIADFGYDYPTGGSGMVFAAPTVRELVRGCRCPSLDSPDDMIIGVCLKNLRIPVTHSPYFHQARPIDYSPEFLSPFKHVSFHKHWMVDAREVYRDWLEEDPTPQHSEL